MQKQQPETEDKRDNRQWHLDKTISISHIFTTISAITAAVIFASMLNTRITVVEQITVAQRAIDARQDADAVDLKKDYRDGINLVRQDMKDINSKMDRLIENVLAKK